MGNSLKMEQKELLYTFFAQGWSIRKINKATGIHRKTITNYLTQWTLTNPEKTSNQPVQETICKTEKPEAISIQSVPPGQNKVPADKVAHFEVPTESVFKSKSKAKIYDAFIRKRLAKGQHAQSIYQDLVIEENYKGSYDSVKRYIRKLKNRSPALYARIETPPGEEAQVDFGQGSPVFTGKQYRKPWLFVMTLSNSRKSYEEVVWKQDVETFIRCHERAFEFFGGVPKIIKIDNLKSGVLQANLYDPVINPHYLSFSKHYSFIPLPCKVRTPEHKGKVESGVKYCQNNALKGKRFESLEEQSRYLQKWNKTWASTRIHGTTKRQVQIMFEEEKPDLQSLPKSLFEFYKIGERKVNVGDSHIEVSGAYYPIPHKYMGKKVTVHYNSKWIKVYYSNKLIQQLSAIAKGQFHPDKSCLPEHKTWSQKQYFQRLLMKCELLGTHVTEWAKQAELYNGPRSYRSIQGVVTLAQKYPENIINQACRKSILQKTFTYKNIKKLTEIITIQKELQPEIPFIQNNELIRSPQEYHNLITGEN